MVYTSKRRKFKDFVRTKNWHYYIIFLLIFATLVVSVLIITKKNNNDNNNTNNNTTNSIENSITNVSNDISKNVKGKYKICVNTAIYQISIYEWDVDNSCYKNDACKYMPVSYDQDINVGKYNFSSEDLVKETWYTTPEGKHYRYATNFNNNISFHTAEFSIYNDKDSLVAESYNNIGVSKTSDGFVLLCADAKWIYENCSYASEVIIYSDNTETISSNITKKINLAPGLLWEPTDFSNSSPYCQTEISEISCIYDYITVLPGTDIANLYKYVKAVDVDNKNINSYIYTTQSGTLNNIQSYTITFYIADSYGNVLSDNLLVNVEEPEKPTEEETTEDESNESESDENQEPSSEDTSEDSTEDSTTISSELPSEEPYANSELSNLDN